MGNIRFALLNICMNFKNEKELKSSFLITVLGMVINDAAMITLWYYFGKSAGVINGWKAYDIFGMYGFQSMAYGAVTVFFYGIYHIPDYISTGSFDRYLLTPKNTLLRVALSSVSVSAAGDFLFGIVSFCIFAVCNHLSAVQLVVSMLLLLEAAVVFFSFSLICMTVSFYLMDGHNVSEGLFGLFLSNSLYHGGAFTGMLRVIFVFVVPSLLLGAVPVEITKNLSVQAVCFMGVCALFWLVISVKFFYRSMRKYESNSLFGFGS